MFYLVAGRARDARELANEIRLDRQPQAKAKAMYAAVVAESFARTGDPEEARKLIETYDPKDKEYGQVAGMLLRAQVYTYAATKKRGRAREAMESERGPNLLQGLSDPVLEAALHPAGEVGRRQPHRKHRHAL